MKFLNYLSILLLFTSCWSNNPSGGTTDPPKDDYELLVGYTAGAEYTDQPQRYQGVPVDGDLRFFYWMDKDGEFDGVLPKDNTYISAITESENGKPNWSRFSNWDRLHKFKLRLPADHTPPIISTEAAFHPITETLFEYPNKNFLYAEWGDTPEQANAKIREWVLMFVANMNDVWGKRKWYWQFSSEPWPKDGDWLDVQDAYFATWLELPESDRPMLATPALPLHHAVDLQEFVPSEMRPYIDLVCSHPYPLRDNRFVNEPQLIIDDMNLTKAFRDAYLPNAELAFTELGFPNNSEQTQYDVLKTGIDHARRIKAKYVHIYNIVQQTKAEPFRFSFLVYPMDSNNVARPVKAFSLMQN